MITRISGLLVGLNEFCATIRIGGFDYEVLLPDIVRRQLQAKVNTEVSLRTIEYLEGNPAQGRLTPRMIGFMNEAELEFFDQVCSVDGLGVKKVLRAMVRPVREIATSIEEKDVKTLSTLPGIGPAMAERIVAKLRRKMTKFALMIAAFRTHRTVRQTSCPKRTKLLSASVIHHRTLEIELRRSWSLVRNSNPSKISLPRSISVSGSSPSVQFSREIRICMYRARRTPTIPRLDYRWYSGTRLKCDLNVGCHLLPRRNSELKLLSDHRDHEFHL